MDTLELAGGKETVPDTNCEIGAGIFVLAGGFTSIANPEHLEITGQGVEAWNRWRKRNPQIQPNLRKAQLHDVPHTESMLVGLEQAVIKPTLQKHAELVSKKAEELRTKPIEERINKLISTT